MSSIEAIKGVDNSGEQENKIGNLIRKLMSANNLNLSAMIGLLFNNNQQQIDPGQALTENLPDMLGNTQDKTPLV